MEAAMHVPNRTGTGILLLTAATALAVAACSSPAQGGGGGSAPSPSGGPGGSGATGSSATPGGGAVATLGPAAAPTSAPAATGYPSDAESYTQAALTAWASGDQSRLDQLRASGNNVFQTISSPAYDHHFQLYQCQGAAGSSYCVVFNKVGDELTLRLSNQLLGQAHAMISGDFQPTTFPADMQAYAQEALDAWLAHNTARMGFLLTPDAVTSFNAIAATHQADGWTFSDNQGAAGSSYLSWKNPAGDRIAFRFHNAGVVPSESPQHRIFEVLWMPH
jgi:hypothetical protein